MLQKEQVKGGEEDIGVEHCGRAAHIKGPEIVRRNLACGGTEKWVEHVSLLGASISFIGLL